MLLHLELRRRQEWVLGIGVHHDVGMDDGTQSPADGAELSGICRSLRSPLGFAFGRAASPKGVLHDMRQASVPGEGQSLQGFLSCARMLPLARVQRALRSKLRLNNRRMVRGWRERQATVAMLLHLTSYRLSSASRSAGSAAREKVRSIESLPTQPEHRARKLTLSGISPTGVNKTFVAQ